MASRYAMPYLPQFLQETVHPLEGTVTHKQRDQDRLLMTVTTADGTILATFLKQVPEIDLLVEEQDSVTLDVGQYEPFVNDPPILKVTKHTSPLTENSSSLPSSMEPDQLSGPQIDVPPPSGEVTVETESTPLPHN